MKHHNSNDKRPQPHGIAPREHYVFRYKTGSYKPKKAFQSEQEALKWVEAHYSHPEKITVYLCSLCNLWHISTKMDNNKQK